MGETLTQTVRYQVTKGNPLKELNISTSANLPVPEPTGSSLSVEEPDSTDNPPLNQTDVSPTSRQSLLQRLLRKSPKGKGKKDVNDNETQETSKKRTAIKDSKKNSVYGNSSETMGVVNQILRHEHEHENVSPSIYELILENNNILKELRKRGFSGDIICPDTSQPLNLVIRDIVAPPNESESLLLAAKKLGLHSFVRLLRATNILSNLTSSKQNITLFAPTDEAFRLLSRETQVQLENPRFVSDVLAYHVITGSRKAGELASGVLETLSPSGNLRVSRLGGTVSIQGASILTSNIPGVDGMLHSLDSVLIPPRQNLKDLIYDDRRLTTFLELIKETDLLYLFSSATTYTVFAPGNEAFNRFPTEELQKLRQSKRLLKAVLLYHIYGPGTLYTNNFQMGSIYRLRMLIRPSVVLQLRRRPGEDGLHISQGCKTLDTDIIASNGVIHIVDTVLLPFGREI